MKLTRNTTPDGRCKYALVRLDRLRLMPHGERERLEQAFDELAKVGLLEYGEKGSEEEFFAIKLKDQFAASTLNEYAEAVWRHAHKGSADERKEWMDYYDDIRELQQRAVNHPKRRVPTG